MAIQDIQYSADGPRHRLSNAELLEPQWEQRARALILQVEAWRAEKSDTAEDVFHQQCAILRKLLSIAPPSSPIRARSLDALLSVLAKVTVSEQTSAHLLFEIDAIIRLTRNPSEQSRQEISSAQKKGIHIPYLPISEPEVVKGALETSSQYVSFMIALEHSCPREYGSLKK